MSQPPQGESESSSVNPTPIAHTALERPTQLAIAALTDVGLTRDNNEDAFLLWDLASDRSVESAFQIWGDDEGPALLAAVSDGMGGQQAGEVASGMALQSLCDHARHGFQESSSNGGPGFKAWMTEGVEEANRRVLAASQADPSKKGMGATLSAVAILEEGLTVAHVGDSRIYLLRHSRLRQLTMDQTRVQSLVAHGHITAEQARTHNERNLLLQAIGAREAVEVDAFDFRVGSGDRLLLCSDGLHGLVDDPELAEVLSSSTTPLDQCEALIGMAKAGGGYDNITVVVAHFG
jgi:protein phosphatase